MRKKLPNDFRFEELVRLLGYFDYKLIETKTGSGVKFYNKKDKTIFTNFHKPHGHNKYIPHYLMKDIYDRLKEEGGI